MAAAADQITAARTAANTFRDSAVTSINSMISQAMNASPTVFTPGTVALGGLEAVPAVPDINTSLIEYRPADVTRFLNSAPELPAGWQSMIDQYFPVSDFDAIIELMQQFIKPEYLDNVRAVFDGNLHRELAARRREVLSGFQDRGFIVPSGAMAGALAGVEAAADDKVREFDSDLAAKAFERWFEFSKWATQAYLDAKQAEFNAFVQLTVAYLKARLDYNISNASALADIAKAEASIKTQVAAMYNERYRLQLSKNELEVRKFTAESQLQIEALRANEASSAGAVATRVKALSFASDAFANVAASAMNSIAGVAVISEQV